MSRRLGVIITAALLVSGAALADDAKEPATKSESQPKKKAKTKAKGKAKAKDKQAEAPPAEQAAPPAPEAEQEWWKTEPHVEGPKLVDLGNQIEIDLPAGFVLF